MIKSFLPDLYHRLFIGILFFSFIFGFWFFFLLVLLIYMGLYFLFRKSKFILVKESDVEEGAIFSPVSGKVVSIQRGIDHYYFGESMIVVRIQVNMWDEYGLYLPAASEIKEVNFHKSEEHFRYKKNIDINEETPNGLCISLLNKNQNTYGIQLIKCTIGGAPQVEVLPGDRGKKMANIGYVPFGGTVLLYIPENYKILINKSDTLTAGVSIIGGE